MLLRLLEMYTFTVENEKRRKTACVFAYVVFFILGLLNPIQEARASIGASTGDFFSSSSIGTPKALISGNRSRNQLLMTG